MATVIHTASGFTRFKPFSRLIARLDRIVARWQAYRRRSRELRELFALDERELRDIGVSRSDFMAIANGTYRRD